MQVVFSLFFGHFFFNGFFASIFAKNLNVLAHSLDRSGFAVVEFYKQCSRKGIGINNGAVALRRADEPTNVRGERKQILISILLIFKTAHKAAATARNFGRVQGKSLLFCHLYGNGLEIIEEARTAEGLTADS